MIFPSSSTRITLLTELNLTVPKARPEAHTFDFITGEGESQNEGNKYEATRSAGDYWRKVQLARLCALPVLFDVALDLLKRYSGIV